MSFKRCKTCEMVTFHDRDGDCWGPEFTKYSIDNIEQVAVEDLQETDLLANYTERHNCRLDDAQTRDDFGRDVEGYADYEDWRDDFDGELYWVIRKAFIIEEALA